MTKIIITPIQLRAINEDNIASNLVTAPSSGVKSAVQTAMAQEPDKDVTVLNVIKRVDSVNIIIADSSGNRAPCR